MNGRLASLWSVPAPQVYDAFVSAGIGDIGNYARLFNMTDDQVQRLWDHMRYYAIIRKCCGTQASSLQREVLERGLPEPGSAEGVAQYGEGEMKENFRVHMPVSLTNGNLVKSTTDFDFTPCVEYDLDAVERLFLATDLSKAGTRPVHAVHLFPSYRPDPTD